MPSTQTGRRSYTMGVRGEQAEATKQRILAAAYELFVTIPYDDATLQRIADHAGVAVQTVLRHFGSKEGLLVAGRAGWAAAESEHRVVEPGDIDGVASVLSARYEQLSESTRRIRAVEPRIPAVADALDVVRHEHVAWLSEVFADWLPRRGALRARRVALLFGATEIDVWTTWRTSLGLSRREAERAMAEGLHALVASWVDQDERSRQ